MKQILLTCLLTVLTLALSAQTQQDMTSYITNPSFENGTKGWTITSLQRQSNSDFSKSAGSYYMERWTAKGNSVGNGSAIQKLADLPMGQYRLKVGAQNLDQNDKTRQCAGAYIYAGSNKETVYTTDDYSVEFTCTSGEIEIGFVADGAKGNWIAVDNFRLYKIGDVPVAEAKTELQAQLEAATTLYADGTGNEAAALKAAIDAAQAVYTDDAATVETIDEVYRNLKKAIFAYHLDNPTEGTGTAPKVTKTNHFVATGATQALMRATMTGSNIVESGVCWSTERNPTVLDSRSTDKFSLNGNIYLISGLTPATVYYVRPYAMNKTYQVAYGDEVKIVTIPRGTCTWSWNEGAPDAAANTRCRNAVRETIEFFNEWTGIKGFHLNGNYGAGTQTADCSYGGWMRIGPNASYQAIGTVLHETGHGVGVGTHTRYADKNLHDWVWLGRQANEVYHFLENDYSNASNTMVGDGMHAWGAQASYDWFVNGADKDTHQELQYIGGMCLLYGMFIDGLDPTSSYYSYTQHNGISGYTYNFDDTKKYYLMNKNADCGLGKGVMYQRSASLIAWKENLQNATLSDSAAWYMEYDAKNCYYLFRNAATGRYLSHPSGISLKSTSSPTSSEWFQLMPDRTDVTIGTGSTKKKTHGYWVTWGGDGDFKSLTAKAMSGSLGYSVLYVSDFDFTNSATAQQWIIISEDELEEYQQAAGATAIHEIAASAENAEQKTFDLQGRRITNPKKGLYIVNGQKVIVK